MRVSARATELAVLILFAAAPAARQALPARGQERAPDVVYVGTPYDVVSRMLRLAGVRRQDLVADLGCGDGRMLVLAAQKYGCRGIGYDIDPERVAAARANARRNGVAHLVTIIQADLFASDFSGADALFLYLLPEINERLLPRFKKMKPGVRLVFHNYGLPGIEADKVLRIVSGEDSASHTLYLYTTPLKPAGD